MSDFAKAFSSLGDAQKPASEEVFEFGAEDKIREAYDFGLFVGLISHEVSFDSFIRDSETVASAGIDDLYDKEIEEVAEEGYLLSMLRGSLLDFASDNNHAVSIDLDFNAEGVVEKLISLEPTVLGFNLSGSNKEKEELDIIYLLDEINVYLGNKEIPNKFLVDQSDIDFMKYSVLYIDKSKIASVIKSPYFNIAN